MENNLFNNAMAWVFTHCEDMTEYTYALKGIGYTRKEANLELAGCSYGEDNPYLARTEALNEVYGEIKARTFYSDGYGNWTEDLSDFRDDYDNYAFSNHQAGRPVYDFENWCLENLEEVTLEHNDKYTYITELEDIPHHGHISTGLTLEEALDAWALNCDQIYQVNEADTIVFEFSTCGDTGPVEMAMEEFWNDVHGYYEELEEEHK